MQSKCVLKMQVFPFLHDVVKTYRQNILLFVTATLFTALIATMFYTAAHEIHNV